MHFFHELVDDLAVRMEWLRQVIDGVPEPQASSTALAHLREWADALRGLHGAVCTLQSHLKDKAFARLFTLEGPLAAFLSRLYAWCDEISEGLENVAVKLRHDEPVLAVFSYKAVNESLVYFEQLGEALRRELVEARPATDEARAAWHSFDDDFDELLWATEWLHVSLGKEPRGE